MIRLPVIKGSKENISKDFLKFDLKKINLSSINTFIIKIKYHMNLLETLFENNDFVKIFWTSGFITWIIGSYFWVVKVYFPSSIFIGLSVVLSLISLFGTVIPRVATFSLADRKLTTSPVILIMTFSVLIMIAFTSVGTGFTSSVILFPAFYTYKSIYHQKTN